MDNCCICFVRASSSFLRLFSTWVTGVGTSAGATTLYEVEGIGASSFGITFNRVYFTPDSTNLARSIAAAKVAGEANTT